MIYVRTQGLFTTIQDLGRYQFQKFGIAVSGAADRLSHRLANFLVDNEESEATIEVTLQGPTLQFEKNTVIALTGANLSPIIDGQRVNMYKPLAIKAGSILKFGKPQNGCRTYIAIHGGLRLPLFFGSRSTYVRGEFGGYEGRPLKKGDKLGLNGCDGSLFEKLSKNPVTWQLSPSLIPLHSEIRVMKGKQFSQFTDDSKERIFSTSYEISNDADRMGVRLQGPLLELKEKLELISEGVTFGTIQVPANGLPIILLADRQTIGGYPKIAQVASVDLPTIAQKKPGEQITFKEISLNKAEQLYIDQEKQLKFLKKLLMIQLKR